MFKVTTKQDVCFRVPARWRRQYPTSELAHDKSKNQISAILDSLTVSELTPERINRVIGNSSWTTLDCDVCGHDVEKVVFLSGEYNDGLSICENCLRKALRATSDE